MMRKLLLLVTVTMLTLATYAQSHTGKFGCYQNKNWASKKWDSENSAPSCPACIAIKKKEHEDKVAADKKKDDAAAAKSKAEFTAKKKQQEAEWAKKNAEDKAKTKAGEVYITMPTSTATNTKTEKKAVKEAAAGKRVAFDGRDSKYRNENGYVEYPADFKDKIRGAYASGYLNGKFEAKYAFPPETGYVKYISSKYCNGWSIEEWDITDYNYKRLFNDESVRYIEHFYGNWFFIGYLPCEEYDRFFFVKTAKLYNVKTKKFVNINITGPVARLKFQGTHGLYHNGDGDNVFHNPAYQTGKFSTTIGDKPIKHGCYELFFDKVLGGADKWKAAVAISVTRSADVNDYYYVIQYIDDKDVLKTYTDTGNEINKYFSQSAVEL